MSKKKDDKKGEEPEIDLGKFTKDIVEAEQKLHIDQLIPAINDAYVEATKYKDDKGVIRFKTKFSKEEAGKLSDKIYDTLGYHSHRRVFGFTEQQYKDLAGIKDANGNSYIDSVTQYHFPGLTRRDDLKRYFTDKAEKEEEISADVIKGILKKPIEGHSQQLISGVVSKHGLEDPRHMGKIKGAIDDIVKEFNLDEKKFDTKHLYNQGELISLYAGLSREYHKRMKKDKEHH